MTTRIHRIFNLQWRLHNVQEALEGLATEIQRLVELEASQQQQGDGKAVPTCIQGYGPDKCRGFAYCGRCQAENP